MSTQVTQPDTALGNTKTRARNYQITINNTINLTDAQMTHLTQGKYIWCREVAPTTGMNHVHIYVEFENARTFKSIKDVFPTAHIESCKGNRNQNVTYVTKHGNFENPGGFYIPPPKYRPEDVISGELYPWQQRIVDIIMGPVDPRKIYWFWEDAGNVGKTTFCKYMYLKYPSKLAFTTAKTSADIILSADENKDTYIIDIPRAAKGINCWTALEELKNGFVTDTKLKKQARIVCWRPPHVIVFANYEPPEEMRNDVLSMDRWCIEKIN